MNVGLVCIARDEGRFLVEWLAHHLSLGFAPIHIYDHQSEDHTAALLDAIGRQWPVHRIPWTPAPNQSPQLTAYAHALNALRDQCRWIAFFDADEFLVFRRDDLTLHDWLSGMPEAVGAVGVNWLTFGSSGKIDDAYDSVRDTFRTGGSRHWGNNRHIKTLARTDCIDSIGIHDGVLHRGHYANPAGEPLQMSDRRGVAAAIDHSVAQLHHYQVKSRRDFDRKMQRGRAGKRMNDPTRIRGNPDEFFRLVDRNSQRYDDIDWNRAAFEPVHHALQALLGAARNDP